MSFGLACAGRLASRTDRNGNLLSDYAGYYGPVGGSPIVQIVNADGWDMIGILALGGKREYLSCAVLRPVAGGLAADEPTPYFLSNPGRPSAAHVRLMPDKSTIELNIKYWHGVRYPRRPVRPNIEQLLELDGKSSHLVSCAPSFLQHARLLWLSLTGFE